MTKGVNLTGRHNGASQQVLAYLRENPNITVPYAELKRVIHAMNDHTVSNAVTNLISSGVPIDRPQRGFCIYRPVPIAPEKAPLGKLFEYVGESGDYIIVRDEVQKLYILKPLADLFNGQASKEA